MSMRGPLAAVAGIAAYGLLSHWLMLHATGSPWAAAIILGPIVIALVAAAIARPGAMTVTGCAIAVLVVAVALIEGGVQEVKRLYVLQYLGLQVMMGFGFAITLRAGSTPLITRMAAMVHREITPALQAYTRHVTVAWVAYFGVMMVLAIVLFIWAPWSVWSVFANLATPVAVVLMFVGERLVRHLRHPEFERVSFAQVWQSWHAAAPVRPARRTRSAPK